MRVLITSLCVSLLAVACGGGKPEPKTPDSVTESSDTDKPKEEEAKPAPKAETAEAEPEKEEVPDSDKKTPQQVITMENVSFVFSFSDSDIKAVRDEECTKKTKGDDAKKAACMTKASQSEVEAEGIRLEKNANDEWFYISFTMPKGKVTDLHRFQVKFEGETKDSIKLIPQGKDTGRKAGPLPKEIVIKVPDAYSMILEDPKKGKMVYRSKVGLLGDSAQSSKKK